MPNKAMGTCISCHYEEKDIAIGRLRAIGEIRGDSEAVDVTCLDAENGYRSYVQGLKDMGEVTLEGFYEKAEEGQALLRALFESGAIVPFTVSFPDGSGAVFSAFVKSHGLGAAQVDGVIGFSAVLRLTGGVDGK